MALVHGDNFSIYGTNNNLLLDGVYAEYNGGMSVDPDGVSSGFVFNRGLPLVNGGFTNLRYVIPVGTPTTAGMALRLWISSLPSDGVATPRPIQFRDAGNGTVAELRVNTTGRIEVALAGGATYTSANPAVTANGWYHIEMKYTATTPGATASFEVRVEGLNVLSQTAVVSTGSAAVAQLAVGGSNNFGLTCPNFYIKDLVVWDSTGTYNNDFLGSVLVYNLVPTADVALNWTPVGAANGFSILDNIPPNDAAYIDAPNPPPAAYKCDLSNLPINVTSVKGLISFIRASKTDGGDANIQTGIISDPAGTPTTVLGANRPITIAKTYWRDVFETDPDTAAPWLPSAVNLAQLQINRTT